MAYVGNNLTVQQYAPQIAYFNGTGSATAFTLPVAVVSGSQIIVAIENVIQNPSSSYSVSGTTLTFTSAPPSGTSNIWVQYTSLQTNFIQPAAGTVQTSSLASNLLVPVANGGTGVTTSTGSGANVLGTSPSLTTPTIASGSILNASGRIMAAQTGGVIQVVSAILGSTFTTTSGSYVTAHSTTITLSSTSSKLISMAWFPISNGYSSYNSNNYAILVNGGATNNQGNGAFQLTTGTGSFVVSIVRYDAPATTSAITVTQSIAMSGGSSMSLLSGAQLILMEVAG
jgi:hypothetical protein